MAVLVKNPERVRAVVNHIVKHFQTKVEPNGFKAQVVTFDRECCVLYKAVMDELIGPEASAVVMTGAQGDPPEWKQHVRDKDDEEKLLDRFRDPADPLQFVIVTSKLLTGFDAPILQVMYLDKPMKDHNLLQAICRTNRTFGQEKTHGLIVDYIGIFDDVARALNFDEKAVQHVVSNIEELRKALPLQVQKCLAFFPGVDRTVGGYEGLMAAQQCLPNNDVRDKFAAQYSVLGTIWEALSPDPCLTPYETDYRWLTQVYESVKPPSGNGKLLWHALGAKTVDLINQNVHVESVRDDVETLVMDAEVLEGHPQGRRPGEEGPGDRDSANRPPPPAPGQRQVRRPRRAAREDQGAPRAGLPHQPPVPERNPRTGQGSRRSREGSRPGGGARPGKRSPDRAVQRSQEPRTPTSLSSASSPTSMTS